jgi:hypothetical protein
MRRIEEITCRHLKSNDEISLADISREIKRSLADI